jgi:hypothetical protein
MSRLSNILLAICIVLSTVVALHMLPSLFSRPFGAGVEFWSVEHDGGRSWHLRDDRDRTLAEIRDLLNSAILGAPVVRDLRLVTFTRIDGPLGSGGRNLRIVHVRYWPLLLLALAYPAARLAAPLLQARRMNRRLATGRCIHCGYHIHTFSRRCPECGDIHNSMLPD